MTNSRNLRLFQPRLFQMMVPAFVLLATGCATSNDWSASGGNRDTAIVKLSYEYAAAQEPMMSEARADELADNRCNTLGYSRAALIPGILRDCTNENGNRCEAWKVTREYQCQNGASLASNLAP